MALDQDTQDLRNGLGRVRVHGDHLAALAPTGHLQLRFTGRYDLTQPVQLRFRLEPVDVQVRPKSAMVEPQANLEPKGCDGGEVDDEDVRVVEVSAGKLAELQGA